MGQKAAIALELHGKDLLLSVLVHTARVSKAAQGAGHAEWQSVRAERWGGPEVVASRAGLQGERAQGLGRLWQLAG